MVLITILLNALRVDILSLLEHNYYLYSLANALLKVL